MRRFIAFTLPLAMSCGPAFAGAGTFRTIRLDLDEGNAVALLESSAQRHVDAMRSIIASRYPGSYDARRWEYVENHMRNMPIARLEYQYRLADGQVVVKTYHAIAGEPLTRVAEQAFAGNGPPDALSTPTTPSTPDTPSPPDSLVDVARPAPPPQATDAELLDAEGADDAFYAGFDETDLRAPFRTGGSSTLKPYWHEGEYHGLDAEQKALHAIEDDIARGRVPAGGSVRGMLSGTSCHLCRDAIGKFASEYELEISFTEMVPGLPAALRRQLIAGGQARLKGLKLVEVGSGRPLLAYDVLAGSRDAQVRASLSPTTLDRGLRGKASFRLAAPRLRRITEPGQAAGESSPGTGEDC